MRKHVTWFAIVGGLLISLLFNNCSAEHAGNSTEGFSVLDEDVFVPCAFTDEQDLFAKTYHQFTTSYCASCHVDGGRGKGAFASSGVQVAYNAFSVVGYEMVSDYAVNPGHQSPFTGSRHDGTISLLKDQWIKGLENIAACKGGELPPDLVPIDEGTRIETRSKAINLEESGQQTTISWSIPADFNDRMGTVSIPNWPGAQLSINVRRSVLGARPIYEISLPTFRAGSTTDVRIKSILVKLNGVAIRNQTTFLYVDEGVRMDESVRLAPGAMVVDGAISPLDVISLSIEKLEAVILPERPILPQISFASSAISINETVTPGNVGSGNNYYQLLVRLNQPSEDYITATIGVLTTGYTAGRVAVNRRTAQTVRLPGDDRDLAIDRWDWDYSLDTSAVVFAPGETEKALWVKIANDERDEQNDEIRFQIASVVNAVRGTTNQIATITIVDDDAAPNVEVPTFSSLMQPGGILYNYCYRCHNSVDNRGGYNLSDYDLMVNNGVLVPFQTSSMMYRRMNEVIPGFQTMPLNGLLETQYRRPIENWILNGAKND